MLKKFRYLVSCFLFIISFFIISNANATLVVPSNVIVEKNSESSIKISWFKDPRIKFYDIYLKKESGYEYISTVKAKEATYYIHDDLERNKNYTYVLRSRTKKETSEYSTPVSIYLGNTYTNVKSIDINDSKIIPPGKSYFLRYTINQEKADLPLYDPSIKWKSSNNKIATIDENGMVNSYQEGVITITAIAHNGVTTKHTLRIESLYAKKIPILTFHRIVSDEIKNNYFRNYQWVAKVSDFEKQMKYLYDNDYKTLSIDEFRNWYDGNIEYPKKTVLITFDDGDYEIYYLVLPILKKYNFKATSFIVGSRTKLTTFPFINTYESKYLGLDKIKEVGRNYPNLEFQSHSYNLHYRSPSNMPIEYSKDYYDLTSDFINNMKFGFKYIAYPYGAYTKEIILAAKNSNIEMGFTFDKYVCATRNSPRYVIPRIKINGQITYSEFVNKMENYLK